MEYEIIEAQIQQKRDAAERARVRSNDWDAVSRQMTTERYELEKFLDRQKEGGEIRSRLINTRDYSQFARTNETMSTFMQMIKDNKKMTNNDLKTMARHLRRQRLDAMHLEKYVKFAIKKSE